MYKAIFGRRGKLPKRIAKVPMNCILKECSTFDEVQPYSIWEA